MSNSGKDLTGVHFRQIDDIDLEGVIVERNNQGKVISIKNTWIPVSTTTMDGVGTNASGGNVDKVEEKTPEEFESGEVAWELSQGTNGEGCGQNLSERGR